MANILMLLCSLMLFGNTPQASSEKEVLDAMNAWKRAMLARDRATLDQLYAPGLIYVHSNGKQENKTEAIDAVVAGKDTYESIEMKDMSVSMHGDTALVKAKIVLRINNGSDVNVLNLDVLHVWIKMPVGWQMVGRHATRLNPN